MSSGSYKQVHVLCPFYQRDDGNHRIICEGLTDNSTINLFYHECTDYSIQITTFCCKYYKNCEIYRMLQNKYAE